jgi:large subunit ribosomal protein L17
MRHNLQGRKLNRTTAHREAMLNNMVTSLFEHERIQTTLPKSKELRRTAEKLITIAKKGGLHSRRIAAKKVHNLDVLKKLFDNIGPRYATRNGGYTRIIKLGNRFGDSAPMSIIELVE